MLAEYCSASLFEEQESKQERYDRRLGQAPVADYEVVHPDANFIVLLQIKGRKYQLVQGQAVVSGIQHDLALIEVGGKVVQGEADGAGSGQVSVENEGEIVPLLQRSLAELVIRVIVARVVNKGVLALFGLVDHVDLQVAVAALLPVLRGHFHKVRLPPVFHEEAQAGPVGSLGGHDHGGGAAGVGGEEEALQPVLNGHAGSGRSPGVGAPGVLTTEEAGFVACALEFRGVEPAALGEGEVA